MEITKYIKRQDSGLKLTPGNSGESSLNLSNEILYLLCPESLSPGAEKSITFKLFKDDFIKAICFIISRLPLYKSSSNSSVKVEYDYAFFKELQDNVESFFGSNNEAEYTCTLLHKTDGRNYLKGLKVGGFSIRNYLVENLSALVFENSEGNLTIRLLSNISEENEPTLIKQEDQLILSETTMTQFVFNCVSYFSEKKDLWCRVDNYVSDANNINEGDSIKISKEGDFSLVGMFKCTSEDNLINFNTPRRRWFSEPFTVIGKTVFLSTEWYPGMRDNGGAYSLMLPEFAKFISICFGEEYQCINNNGTWELWYKPSLHVQSQSFNPRDWNNAPSQIIYYGAPGTGKSHTIKNREDSGLRCIRTTFHPDTDYSTFVGCYKPHRNKETGDLTYEFVEQAFLETYILAWENPQEEIALVIEEINRGNCAQIFGDIFQLLDRDKDGWSTYPIKADTDICERLTDIAIPGYSETMSARYGKDKEGYGFMALPPNMSILATMNTSDQSLFPIDSAFKRRWDWQYMPIANGGNNWKIVIGTNKFDWWRFVEKINAQIGATTSSEDKKLGYFFCKAIDGRIDAKTFVGKVVFYLWNDVFKDYEFEGPLFEDTDGEKLTFDKFYKVEAGQTIVETSKVLAFLRKLDATINPTVHMEEKGTDVENENGESSNTTGYVAAKFSLNGGSPLSMTQIAKQVVSDYAAQHPTENGEQIRDAFNTACSHIVVETEDDYKARLEKAEKTHGGQELVLESGEKIYTSNQWEWKSADSNFARFMTVVNENGWGEIVEIKDNNE